MLGRKVQALRKQRGMTQADLAGTIGRSEDMVSNVERGVASTRLTTAYDIAGALGVSLPDLFDFTDLPKGNSELQRLIRDIDRLLNKHDVKTVKRVRAALKVMLSQT